MQSLNNFQQGLSSGSASPQTPFPAWSVFLPAYPVPWSTPPLRSQGTDTLQALLLWFYTCVHTAFFFFLVNHTLLPNYTAHSFRAKTVSYSGLCHHHLIQSCTEDVWQMLMKMNKSIIQSLLNSVINLILFPPQSQRRELTILTQQAL